MKVTACLLLLASTAMAAPNKEAKAFSLFSVVTFPNDECTTVMDPTMRGLCITAEECTDQGGTASGNCASGFGVCCFTTVTDAGAITNNVTYIQNEGFPTAVLGTAPVTAATRAFTVQGGENICQVRFDFEAATVFEGPTAGACAGDAITVGQTTTTIGNGFTNLCGTLSGQHIYVENDGANPAATLNVDTSATVLARTWKILVRTIECDSPAKAPGGCLQYFTGTSGNIVSFNAGTTGALLDDLLYNVCIRREAGMCSYTVRQARSATGATPDAFQVGTGAVGAVGAANCATGAFLIIPNSGVQAPEYCGSVLTNTNADTTASPVTGNGAQFQITVLTTAANTGAAASGFDLVYAQVGC